MKKATKNDAGMDELEAMIAEFKEQDRKENTVSETVLEQPPSPRSHVTFLAHPEKDFLVLFGGEYFNGKMTEVFNQIYLYNIKVSFCLNTNIYLKKYQLIRESSSASSGTKS